MLKKKEESKKINPLKKLKDMAKERRDLEAELEEQGMVVFTPPMTGRDGNLDIDSNFLSLPSDITDCTSKQLGEYLNAFTQHRMYMRTLVGWQKDVLEYAKRDYYASSNPLYGTLTKKDFPSESSKERFMNNHPTVLPYFNKMRDENRKLELILTNLASIDDAIFLISREISRRGGDFNTERRNENVQSR